MGGPASGLAPPWSPAPGDGHILRGMPWPIFGEMIERDLEAIYEYLSAIPRATPGP